MDSQAQSPVDTANMEEIWMGCMLSSVVKRENVFSQLSTVSQMRARGRVSKPARKGTCTCSACRYAKTQQESNYSQP